MPQTESLTLIERYGSFGLLCVIVLAALALGVLFLHYLKNDLIPRAFAYLEKRDTEHAAQLEKRDAEHAVHLKEREATCRDAIANNAKLADVVAALVIEVKALKDSTD